MKNRSVRESSELLRQKIELQVSTEYIKRMKYYGLLWNSFLMSSLRLFLFTDLKNSLKNVLKENDELTLRRDKLKMDNEVANAKYQAESKKRIM